MLARVAQELLNLRVAIARGVVVAGALEVLHAAHPLARAALADGVVAQIARDLLGGCRGNGNRGFDGRKRRRNGLRAGPFVLLIASEEAAQKKEEEDEGRGR